MLINLSNIDNLFFRKKFRECCESNSGQLGTEACMLTIVLLYFSTTFSDKWAQCDQKPQVNKCSPSYDVISSNVIFNIHIDRFNYWTKFLYDECVMNTYHWKYITLSFLTLSFWHYCTYHCINVETEHRILIAKLWQVLIKIFDFRFWLTHSCQILRYVFSVISVYDWWIDILLPVHIYSETLLILPSFLQNKVNRSLLRLWVPKC